MRFWAYVTLVLAAVAAASGCGGGTHAASSHEAKVVSELQYSAEREAHSRASNCPHGRVFVQADKVAACLMPAQTRHFRRFAAACASTRSKLHVLANRYFDRERTQVPTVQQQKHELETLGREAEGVLAGTTLSLRSIGAEHQDLQLVAERRAGLASFVREVRRAKSLGFIGGWIRLFGERATPCGPPTPNS
jgi:hypothetical protein